jgi:signal transduction histidine kinase
LRVSFQSVRTQLAVLFFAITAAAVVFIFIYVVPQLRSSLTAEKLRRLQADAAEQTAVLSEAVADRPSQARVRRLAGRLAQRSGARVTILGVREGEAGPRPAFVIADSDVEREALLPSYPAAVDAALSGEQVTAVERVGDDRVGETAVPVTVDGEPRWVAVFSTTLADVEANVEVIERQILIAGTIALIAALGAGWLAARAHARRLRRLEEAAEKVAEGDFGTPIPVDSGDEVGQLAATLNEMRARLERLDSARKEFIANASHELRTPIFSLGGFVELLEEEDADPEARAEFVRAMRGQIERLTKLATDLLDLSKLDADALSVSSEPVELGATAARVAAEFRPRAERTGHTLVVADEPGPLASADPDRVEQIVRILIDNALSHTPEGTEITVTASLQQGEPTLAVADDGPGIDPAARAKVFDRFFTGGDGHGSGLGLAIARELARLMGGDLELDARRGRTVFELRLPAAHAEARA